MEDLRADCKKKLDKIQEKGYDIFKISKYASDEYLRMMYDETWTEYRVLKLLKRNE